VTAALVCAVVWLFGVNIRFVLALRRRARELHEMRLRRDAACQGWRDSMDARKHLEAQLDSVRADNRQLLAQLRQYMTGGIEGWRSNPSPPPGLPPDVPRFVNIPDDWDEKRH
jgi:hypothetical protein